MTTYTRRPLGGRILTRPFIFLLMLFAIGIYFMAKRFLFGIGAVSNLSGGYPWGVWIGMDVVVGTALGCGGFAMALLVYIFNRNSYSPLMRPAMMASVLGYTLAGVAVMVDIGRYWQAYNLLLPWYAQINSVMFEVALCIMAYCVILWIEFSPAILERLGLTRTRQFLRKHMYIFAAINVLLPTMHQSSLGSMLLVMGSQLSPLWHTTWLPLLYLTSAIAMGYGVVMLETTLVTRAFALSSKQKLLARLSPIAAALLGVFLVVRVADIAARGHLDLVFAGDRNSLLFFSETLLLAVPALLFASPAARLNQRLMFLAAVSVIVGGSVYRLNGFLIAYDPVGEWTYFPAVGELMITIGIFALEIMLYLIAIKKLPVLPSARAAAAGQEV